MPSASETLFLFVIDIADSRRRARVRAWLAMLGTRVGRDAYEIITDDVGARRARETLERLVTPEDALRVYPVCRRCRGRCVFMVPSLRASCRRQ